MSDRATSEANQETYLAYLPLAHILEFAAEMSMLVHGAKMGYSDPKTLSSAGALRQMPDGSLNNQVRSNFDEEPLFASSSWLQQERMPALFLIDFPLFFS